jgi:uncharacterized protein (UPF0332 family)
MNPPFEEAAGLWDRALRSLKAAERLTADGFDDFAASRAYYAAFYAASALLLCEGKKFSRHAAVQSAIHRDYIKSGRIPAEAGTVFDSLSDLRKVGDYGGLSHVASTAARDAIANARSFLDAVEPLLPPEVHSPP